MVVVRAYVTQKRPPRPRSCPHKTEAAHPPIEPVDLRHARRHGFTPEGRASRRAVHMKYV